MQPLPAPIEHHFQKNYERHAFSVELTVNVQRLRGCFKESTLPRPTAQVIAAWNGVPNARVDTLPKSLKTGSAPLKAPPPTPTGLSFDIDDTTSSESSFGDILSDDWVFVDDMEIPTADMLACRELGGSPVSDDSMSQCSYPDQRSEKPSVEDDSLEACDGNSPLSSPDHDNFPPDRRYASTPVGFYNMVNQWYLDYRVRGADAFAQSLISFGMVSPGTAPLASRIARTIIRKVARTSYTKGKSLENTIRFSALTSFKNYWESDDTWMLSSIPRGIRIAGFIGSLFDAKVSTARDIHLCLSYLLEGERSFNRLLAMHALLTQANDKLCKSRNLPALIEFKHEITSRDKRSGKLLWTTTPFSEAILADILVILDRWTASQALRREQFQIPTGSCVVRNKAVGPRLRGGPVAIEEVTL